MATPRISQLREADLGLPDGEVTGAQVREAFKKLFSQMNPWLSQVNDLLARGIRLGENVRCEVVTAQFTHGTPQPLRLGTLTRASGAVILGWDGQVPAVPPMVQMDQRGELCNVTVWFKNVGASARVSLLLLEDGLQSSSSPPAFTP